ncbi:uncharacterized protein GGS22DRAFT_101624 [Annulohypoxylon maeteangense]|uniref:uncharacterized protein n=1 Tax=Annulohypoxylon maeteangense TaxID=1927788 RepID=UPI002007CD83|nr:uncharacterized protein GGS22DRAFT_101624 [Annulohypoxylon maeteangense]KAI0880018.1 hypothetical protein GGS22DRAFT_101624 [Annulohypoxylon maeteangense]
MGNTHTKDARGGSRIGGHGSHMDSGGSSTGAGYHGDLPDRSRRASRPELGGLTLQFGASSSSRHQDSPFEHRETKQEKEARRLERERVARLKERERSMREEHIDGGFLVTMGVYSASEDFNKSVVRQLQIERRIAPFWRGLDDFNDNWAEHQIIAAARGLEIPLADEVPESLIPQPRSVDSPATSTPTLTVPMGPRTLSISSDNPASNPGSALPSPTSPAAPRTSSPFKPHKKSLAAALNLSRSGPSTDIITPREINLPNDPFVNGQPLEVFLYKEGIECPLCLMYYPPYLNRTRCCCQIICSECFVQIKRPDPHLPEHHADEEGVQAPANPEEREGELIMEPAKCPYCTQTEFGVTYEPPPFRRGLTYAFSPSTLGAMTTAMSSSSSLNSTLSPTLATPSANANRRRAQSVSANAPGVITTDRIRPDWSTKLAAARAQQRRRAAAADALHHAAFVMGNQESRTIFGRSSRFSRRNTGGHRGNESPGNGSSLQPNDGGADIASAPDPGARTTSSRAGPSRERIDAAHLESLMMAEAIRLSLADEEERRKKAEKEARKEAKKREKEDRKASKKKGDVYGGSGGGSSASASSLSLGLGRRRGNSAASNLRIEASVTAASSTTAGQAGDQLTDPSSVPASTSALMSSNKGKAIDRNDNEEGQKSGSGVASLPIPVSSQPARGSSHLRQMSNASSVSSSGLDSMPGSYTGKNPGADSEDPRSSGLSIAARSEEGDSTNSEPMFNFRSLAEMVGVPIDGEAQSPNSEDMSPGSKPADAEEAHGEHVEHATDPVGNGENSKEELTGQETQEVQGGIYRSGEKGEDGTSRPPQLMVTPDTPAPADGDEEDSKRLGHVDLAERSHEVTQ